MTPQEWKKKQLEALYRQIALRKEFPDAKPGLTGATPKQGVEGLLDQVPGQNAVGKPVNPEPLSPVSLEQVSPETVRMSEGRRIAARIKQARAAEGSYGNRVLRGVEPAAGERAAFNVMAEAGKRAAAGSGGGLLGDLSKEEMAGLAADEAAAPAVATGAKGLLGRLGKFVPGVGWVMTGAMVADALKEELVDKPRANLADRAMQTFEVQGQMSRELEMSRAELEAEGIGHLANAGFTIESGNAALSRDKQIEMGRLLEENKANLSQAAVLGRPSMAELYAAMGA